MLDRGAFVDSVPDFVTMHRERLLALRGNRIESSWVAWDVADDVWFNDEAVILAIGDERLEIVFFKLHQVALTWNLIDLSSSPAWVAEWGSGFQLEWRPDALPALKEASGAKIREIFVTEYLFRTTVIEDPRDPSRNGTTHQSWILNGLELRHDAGTLTVFNALDSNGVTNEAVSGDYHRRHCL